MSIYIEGEGLRDMHNQPRDSNGQPMGAKNQKASIVQKVKVPGCLSLSVHNLQL